MKTKIEKFVQSESFNEFDMEHTFVVDSNSESINLPIKGTSQRRSKFNNRKMYKVCYKIVGVLPFSSDRLYVTYIFERVYLNK